MVFTFPADLYSTDPNFTTLFRLLDDFDTYSREVQDESASTPAPASRGGRHRRGPRPRFGRYLYHIPQALLLTRPTTQTSVRPPNPTKSTAKSPACPAPTSTLN